MGESYDRVVIFNHNGPVYFYYFSDSTLHFYSIHYREDSLIHEKFKCWSNEDKIYTEFDDSIRTSIKYEFRSVDTLALTLEKEKMLFVKRNYPLNQLENLINKTFFEVKDNTHQLDDKMEKHKNSIDGSIHNINQIMYDLDGKFKEFKKDSALKYNETTLDYEKTK
jgi:hypothetical protein